MRHETESAFGFALVLTAGAYEGGVLEVRRAILSRDHRKHWEARRYTLSQQIEASGGVGAWGHILQQNGRRWVWTTAQGRAQLNTLERWTPRFPIEVLRGRNRRELQAEVLGSVTEGMREADPDGRSRRVSVRGFDPDEITQRWRFEDQRDEITYGGDIGSVFGPASAVGITPDELPEYLTWLDHETENWIKKAVDGLPVSAEIKAMDDEIAYSWPDKPRLVVVERTRRPGGEDA